MATIQYYAELGMIPNPYRGWVGEHRTVWEMRLDRLGDLLAEELGKKWPARWSEFEVRQLSL